MKHIVVWVAWEWICVDAIVYIVKILGRGNKLTHTIHYTLFTKKVNITTEVNLFLSRPRQRLRDYPVQWAEREVCKLHPSWCVEAVAQR